MTLNIDQHYAELERRFPPRLDRNYERLVVAHGNAEERVHRWFHMKEAFSPYLLTRILKDLEISPAPGFRVFDPFAGSGTTVVSALTLDEGVDIEAAGSEVNPFLHLLADTKAAVLSLDADARRDVARAVEAAAAWLGTAAGGVVAPPALSAFNNRDYFPAGQLQALLTIREGIRGVADEHVRRLLCVALAASLEACSKLRRDGRALRFVSDKRPATPANEFRRRVNCIVDDLRSVNAVGRGRVRLATALAHDAWPEPSSVDLVVFSPPYPNNIDYTEVYKLEAWFLRLIEDEDDFRLQRLNTMISHPSLKFRPREHGDVPRDLLGYAEQLAEPVLAAVPADRYAAQRHRVIRGYVGDSAAALWRCHNALSPGSHAVYVVGNSRHGAGDADYTIASDVLLAALAAAVGFEVVEVKVARNLVRRGRHAHLRESVVILRKRA